MAVTMAPVRTCVRQSITIPWPAAISTTIMLAMLPTISRFPANVLTTASSGPAFA